MNVVLQNLSKSYGGNDILNDFSLDIASGTRLAVCGANGCGKSTLIRIMANAAAPDSGRVIFPKGCRIGYVEQNLDDEVLGKTLIEWVLDVLPDWHDFWQDWDKAHIENNESQIRILMERQHDIEARYGYNPEQQAQTVLSGLGFAQKKWGKPMRELSGGWRERAKLARVLTAGADVLLLDEPTNHLDMDAVEWLENFLLNYKGVLVFVAHDRFFMDKIGTHILYMGNSKPVFRKATFTQFLSIQEELEEQKEREAKKLAGEIEKKMDFVRRFGAKATKARQANSKLKMAKKLMKDLGDYQPEAKRRELDFSFPEAAKCEKVVLSVADLDFAFPDGKKVWKPLTFTVFRGQRIAVVGHNGSGKSTLLKIISGNLQKTAGSLVLASQAKIGYFSQHQEEVLNPQSTVLGEMRRLSDPHTTEEELMSVLGLFMLGHGYFERFIYTLSGGERSRLSLSLLFLARCNFLILDEPTNHLDLESRQALIEALDAYDGTLFLVAHDRYLLSEVADEIWEITEEGIRVFENGFAEYDAYRKTKPVSLSALAKNGEVKSIPSLSRDDLKKIKREQAEERNKIYKKIKPLQEKYDKTEEALSKLFARQSEVEVLLADPVVFENGLQASELLKEFHALQLETEKILEDLEKLEQEIEVLQEQSKAYSLD